MRAVLDTNVLISAVIATGTPHEVVVDTAASIRLWFRWRRCWSFGRPCISTRIGSASAVRRSKRRSKRCGTSEFVAPDVELDVVDADPDDDKFLEAAVAGNVEDVVSGDQHLLDIEEFRGIEIVTPRTVSEIVQA